jgi:peptidoglycan/xylan/chitin deacetylase (PgdA/CDA1 family)
VAEGGAVDAGARWPGGARGALCLTFDNLGEAAAIELGAITSDDPSIGRHPTATRVLPALLEALGERGLTATFFVEGLNAELYPEALRQIAARGHEVSYHAWRHEQWDGLSAEEQADNLRRGIEAFRRLGAGADDGAGIDVAGLRPPGGRLGAGGLDVLREAGLRYASPAGEGAGVEDGIALLPFQWRHVDASCLLPPLAPIREQMTGSPDPLDPGTFLTFVEAEIARLAGDGGFVALVLHLSLVDWLGEERLGALLDLLGESSDSGRLWLARCDVVAEHVLAHAGEFRNTAVLDPVSWG